MAKRGRFSELNELIAAYDMIPAGCTVLCAVSGGADSVYLLHRLNHLRGLLNFRLAAAHYNHQLRGDESDRDEQFVRDFVARYCGEERLVTAEGERILPPVWLIVGRGDVAGEAARRGTGLEETARAMRYAFLEETAAQTGADRIATAHTADDNTETMLLHLLRGSGLQGLGGIRPRRDRLIRPMLTTSRRTVEEYLGLYAIPHVEDSSNNEDTFLRNRLRHQAVPLLEELAPGFSQRMGEMAALLRADEEYLDHRARRVSEKAQWNGACLVLLADEIAGAPDAVAMRVVRQMLCRLRRGLDQVSAAHLKAVAALCRGNDPSARADLPDGLAAWREYELLWIGRYEEAGLEPFPVEPPGVYPVAGTGWELHCRYGPSPGDSGNDGFFCAACDTLKGALMVRARQQGDSLALPGRPARSLKKLLIDRKIPRRERNGIPVLADDAGVLSVAGFGSDCRRQAQPGQTALWIAWKRAVR